LTLRVCGTAGRVRTLAELPNVEAVLPRHVLPGTTADIFEPNGAGAHRGRSCWKRKPSRD
jgi:hypothetical protein